MRYKVGDKVKIREDLVHGVKYGISPYLEQMQLKGRAVEISQILGERYMAKGYGDWLFTEEMIEPNLVIESISIEDLLDNLGDEAIMVNCANLGKAVKFLELLHEKGYTWTSKQYLTDKNRYSFRGNETVYRLHNKEVGVIHKNLSDLLTNGEIIYSYETGRALDKQVREDEVENTPSGSFARLCDDKYNTAEMLAELAKNTSRHFCRIHDGLIVSASDKGDILWKSGHDFLNVEHEWEEVAKKVSFREAFRAWNEESKTICCKTRSGETLWYRGTWELDYDFNSENIAYGEWFIDEQKGEII